VAGTDSHNDDGVASQQRTHLTTSKQSREYREETLWIATSAGPLFGRLTLPMGDTSRGGVLISPPIGREARLARRALRHLSMLLARDGFVSLRFDHFGTGDSGGALDAGTFGQAWIEGVHEGVALLRSLGIKDVSAVGMRMGCTIMGVGASAGDLSFSAAVLWDPCETGRTYLREADALAALGRTVVATASDSPDKMSEFVYSDAAVKRIGEFDLKTSTSPPLAERVLMIVRDGRVVSSSFRERWTSEEVTWITTSEQAPMLDTELPLSVEASATIDEIRLWLAASPAPFASYRVPDFTRDSVVATNPSALPVRERIVEFGPRRMFAVLSEPVEETRGPLVVMINGINEDHVGPSRLWVDLSRRWAGVGFRSLRFDFSDIAESPWVSDERDMGPVHETGPEDIARAIRDMIPMNPADSILIGLCSGAQMALLVAKRLKSRGVCAINPQVGGSIRQRADRLGRSERTPIQSFAHRVESQLQRHRWVSKSAWQLARLVLPSAYSPRFRASLVNEGSALLILVSPDDVSPFPRIPVLGSIDRRRLASSQNCRVEILPGLDHDFLGAAARARAVSIIDEHILSTFGVVSA
jgi:pimeloyl-ACP methyl ester carboxylesterase